MSDQILKHRFDHRSFLFESLDIQGLWSLGPCSILQLWSPAYLPVQLPCSTQVGSFMFPKHVMLYLLAFPVPLPESLFLSVQCHELPLCPHDQTQMNCFLQGLVDTCCLYLSSLFSNSIPTCLWRTTPTSLSVHVVSMERTTPRPHSAF